MRYRLFRTVDHWVVAAQLGEHRWRVVDRADDELSGREKLARYGRKRPR